MLRTAYLRAICCIWLLCCAYGVAQNGEFKGKVRLMRNGRQVSDASKVVVWLTPLGSTPAPPPPRQQKSQIPQLVQKDKSFHPSLLVIPVGGKVEFPNHDPFFHNVFSLSDVKMFDLGSYPQGKSKSVQFDKPGKVEIECAIHPQMHMTVEVK